MVGLVSDITTHTVARSFCNLKIINAKQVYCKNTQNPRRGPICKLRTKDAADNVKIKQVVYVIQLDIRMLSEILLH